MKHRSAFSVQLHSEDTPSLFRLADALLTSVGYQAGRVRKETSATDDHFKGIRAPGPAIHTQSLGKDDNDEELIGQNAKLDRENASFHVARRKIDSRKARVSTTRAGEPQRAISRHNPRFLGIYSNIKSNAITPSEKQQLNSLFQSLKQQEGRKVDKNIERRIANRRKFRLFDSETYRTRLETSKEAELEQRMRARVTPVLVKARSRLLSAHSDRSTISAVPPPPQSPDLKSYLSSVLVGRTYSTSHHVSEYQDHSLLVTRLQWLAHEGVNRFIPHLQVKPVSL